jgi:hypothetical protein
MEKKAKFSIGAGIQKKAKFSIGAGIQKETVLEKKAKFSIGKDEYMYISIYKYI